jgi:hypothetical protein
MKHSLFFVSFLISFTCYSQKYVEIRGIAKDTTKNRSFVQIAVNDTLSKLLNSLGKNKKWNDYQSIKKNKNLYTTADSTGIFNIKAKLKDSISFYSSRYYKQTYSVPDLLKMNPLEIKLVPEPCIPFIPCQQISPTNYYVFIGEKIDLKSVASPYYCDVIPLDSGFRANYKIMKSINGNFPEENISFLVYDHYGTPKFSKYKNVMLFVVEVCGKLVHMKYQFFDVYKTKNGEWATPGNPFSYDEFVKRNLMQPEKIEFGQNAYVNISKLQKSEILEKYPKEYYKIIGKKAIPLKGTYIKNMSKVIDDIRKYGNE